MQLSAGAHVVLFVNCFLALWRRKRTYLLAYILALFSLSTAAIGLQIWWSQVAFIDNHSYPGGPNLYMEDHVNSSPNKAVTAAYVHQVFQ